MAVPKYYEMQKPFLTFLKDGKAYRKNQIMEHLREVFQLTEADLEQRQPSGLQTVFSNRVGWAATYLKKAGLIVSPSRGQYAITEQGRGALLQNPDVINNKFLTQYPSFQEFQNISSCAESENNPASGSDETPDEIIENAVKRMNAALADELLAEVMKMTPVAFERFALDLMKVMGYGKFDDGTQMTSTSNDEGIDGIIKQDKLGFDLIYVQAKHWNADNPVGRPEVQAFVGAISGKGGKGLFVTTSKFTKQAVDYAHNHHIILVDGRKLAELMIENNFGVSVKNTYTVKSIDTDIFNEYEEI